MMVREKPRIVLEEGSFRLFAEGKEAGRSARKLEEMREVGMDKGFFKGKGFPREKEIYYMYRGVGSLGKLRYDITVIPPFCMGKEFVKTAGHYHPEAKPELSFCEIYQVLEGNAHYLLQRREKGKVVEVALVKAGPGDIVVIPPNWGHTTINPSKANVLVMANLVDSGFESDYSEYRKMNGASYYETVEGKLVRNPKYVSAPEIGIFDADGFGKRTGAYERLKEKDLLEVMRKEGKLVEFLSDPSRL